MEELRNFNPRSISLRSGEPREKVQEIKDYFNKTFMLYDKLFECLADDSAYYARANPLRHPLIFYYGHTATFFINKMVLAKMIPERINPEFESMFAIGVDEMSWDDLNEEHYDWPKVEEVRAYRNKAARVVNNYLDSHQFQMPIDWDHPLWVIMMGIEHERIHLETSSVLIRQLPLEKVKSHGSFPIHESREKTAPENELIPLKGGDVALGRSFGSDFYGWDNEFGTKSVEVADLSVSKFLVSNAEFMDFVTEGGYREDEYWSEEGSRWKKHTKAEMPEFWRKNSDGTYKLRTMLEEVELPLNFPVEVCWYEANAFCRWKSQKIGRKVRIPSEAEWYHVVDLAGVPDSFEWRSSPPGNINLEFAASSMPVNRFENNGLYDLIGNVWQWTSSSISSFAGFKPHDFYDDFSIPTFDGQHYLMKGGSWISTGNEALRASRYAFRAHFYQHCGFRYVEGEELELDEVRTANVYESDKSVSEYCEFHFGEEHYGVKNFAKACAEFAMNVTGEGSKTKALDLGCAVGRSSMELAKVYDHVTGIDFSARFIDAADRLLKHGRLSFKIQTEGDLCENKTVSLQDIDCQGVENKVSFFQGDACNLKDLFSGYDLIMAANMIDRLYDPTKFLKGIHTRLNPGGYLVLFSPYTWLEEYTSKENWLGGYEKDGKIVKTIDGLKRVLGERFDLVGDPKTIEFVIRETSRKFQHSRSEATVWKLK